MLRAKLSAVLFLVCVQVTFVSLKLNVRAEEFVKCGVTGSHSFTLIIFKCIQHVGTWLFWNKSTSFPG